MYINATDPERLVFNGRRILLASGKVARCDMWCYWKDITAAIKAGHELYEYRLVSLDSDNVWINHGALVYDATADECWLWSDSQVCITALLREVRGMSNAEDA